MSGSRKERKGVFNISLHCLDFFGNCRWNAPRASIFNRHMWTKARPLDHHDKVAISNSKARDLLPAVCKFRYPYIYALHGLCNYRKSVGGGSYRKSLWRSPAGSCVLADIGKVRAPFPFSTVGVVVNEGLMFLMTTDA